MDKSSLDHIQTNSNNKAWIYSYIFISKYYASDKALKRMELVNIKDQIEFMTLAYLIFLNDKNPGPKNFVSHLLNEVHLIHLKSDPQCQLRTIQENKNDIELTLIIFIQLEWIFSHRTSGFSSSTLTNRDHVSKDLPENKPHMIFLKNVLFINQKKKERQIFFLKISQK
jgi:hypothetical protein